MKTLCKLILAASFVVFAFSSEVNLSNDLIALGVTKNQEKKLGIYHGVNTKIKEHPYLVGILVNSEFSCAGTIITKRWVITLADCVENVNSSSLTVVAGSEDGINGSSHAVVEVVTHPSYGSLNLDYDYSLLQLTKNFSWSTITRPVHLPSEEPPIPVRMTVVGYGDTKGIEGSSSSSSLQQGRMTWLSKGSCEKIFADLDISWTERMACAYSKKRRTTLCKGDFGDPFVRNGKYYGHFIGGATAGFCSPSARPVILADVYSVLDWVKNVTGALS